MYLLLMLLVAFVSFLITFLAFPVIIPRLKKVGIIGKNMHSEKQEEVPEMGGMVMVAGFSAGIISIIFLKIFYKLLPEVSLIALLATLSTVLIVALIGIFDDLFSMRQITKAFLPVFAALPLMAIKIGDSILNIPTIGRIDFGVLYPLALVPLGITGATNAFNMLAGFNGLEVGLGLVCMFTVSTIAFMLGEMTALLISLSCLGVLVATIYYNWYPAKVLVGDIGTLCMGSVLAICVIVGNFETAGVILIIPFVVDFTIKAIYGFPYTFGVYKDGKLYCPDDGPKGLAHIILKLFGGMKETNLVMVLIGIEAVFGVSAILFYYF